jgi:hypothetical protein
VLEKDVPIVLAVTMKCVPYTDADAHLKFGKLLCLVASILSINQFCKKKFLKVWTLLEHSRGWECWPKEWNIVTSCHTHFVPVNIVFCYRMWDRSKKYIQNSNQKTPRKEIRDLGMIKTDLRDVWAYGLDAIGLEQS